jgi:hypothetical protein
MSFNLWRVEELISTTSAASNTHELRLYKENDDTAVNNPAYLKDPWLKYVFS